MPRTISKLSSRRSAVIAWFVQVILTVLFIVLSGVSWGSPRTIDILHSFTPRAQWLYHYSVSSSPSSGGWVDTSSTTDDFEGTKQITVVDVTEDTVAHIRRY